VTNQKDLLNVIIPFFMRHQLRSGKLLSFLHFKYIVETLTPKTFLKDQNVLSFAVIAGQINPSDKLGNRIRHLRPNQIHHVKNNIQPEGVDISKLTESIANFKQNPLTLDFVHGLFESNTNNLRKVSIEDQNFIRDSFLPKGIEIWKFKEHYLSLNPRPAQAVLGTRCFSSYAKLHTKAGKAVVPTPFYLYFCKDKNKDGGDKIYPNAAPLLPPPPFRICCFPPPSPQGMGGRKAGGGGKDVLNKLGTISENKDKCGIYRCRRSR